MNEMQCAAMNLFDVVLQCEKLNASTPDGENIRRPVAE